MARISISGVAATILVGFRGWIERFGCGRRMVWGEENKKRRSPDQNDSDQDFRRTAATYSPNWWVSTIGADELNDSVRDGKRWIHTAITTAVYF